MQILPKLKFDFLKPHKILDWLRQLSTSKQFIYIFCGFIFLLVIEVTLGLVSYLTLKNNVIGKSVRFDNSLRTISRMKTDLSELQLIYNEKYSQVDTRSPESTIKKISKEANALKGYLRRNLASVKTSLSKIQSLASAQIDYNNYQQVRAEIKKIRDNLKSAEQTLRRLRQNGARVRNIYLAPVTVVIFSILFAILLYILIVNKIIKNHLSAMHHFEEITQKYSRGIIVNEVKDYPGFEYNDLKEVLTLHFQSLQKNYNDIYRQASEIFPMIKDLAGLTEQNEEQFIAIKQDFQNLIDNTYHKLDSFPGVADRIKKLNRNLTESQLEEARLQKTFNEAGDYFENGPLKIDGIEKQIDEREKSSREVTAELKKLSIILDGFIQTSSLFQGIAEQTAVLSLNASIEAARVGTAGDGFDIAATEISDLAEKISRAPHELLVVISTLRKKTESAVRIYEASISQSVHGRNFLREIKEKLNVFWEEYDKYLIEIKEYGKLVHEFEDKQKTLEKLTSFLAELNLKTPENYARVSATLEVISKTEKISISLQHLAQMLVEINQIVDKLQDK